MAYQKHRWVHKEIIKAENLNHIEEGIYDEETRAMQAEELLGQSSSTESSRAIQAETALGSRITQTENAITTLNADDQTPGSVDYKIAQSAQDFGGYKIVMDHTLVANPSDKYIYLEPDAQATGSDKFSEWAWTDYFNPGTFAWHQSGEVSLDLSGYIKNTDYATSSTPGIVIVDGTTIQIQNGVISAVVTGGVTSFNGRTGAITPASGDYTASDVGLGDVGNFKAVSTVANQGLSDTEKSNARANIGLGCSQYYGTCSTAAATQTKEVTVSADQNFRLHVGARVTVKFSNSNTYSATASAPCKLNVNSTGAKNIYYNNTATPTGTNTTAFGYANRIASYIYDGTYWVWDGMGSEADTRDFKMGTTRSGATANILYFVYT